MNRRAILLTLCGLGTLVASLGLSLLLLGADGPARPCPPSRVLPGGLRLEAPVGLAAGRPLSVSVRAPDAPAGLAVTVMLLRADGPIAREVEIVDGVARATFEGRATRAAGHARVIAAGCGLEADRVIHIQPGPPAEPVEVLVGARRIVADGASEAFAMTVPLDTHGNPVADGTAVRFELRRADGRRYGATLPTERLLSVLRVEAGTVAGRTTIAARAGEARSDAADLIESPGRPVAGFTIRLEDGPDLAAPGQERTVVIDDLRDGHGNRIADGVLATAVLSGPGISGHTAQAPLIDGGARLPVRAPHVPGVLSVRAVVDGVWSRPLAVPFVPRPTRSHLPLVVDLDEGLGLLWMRLGPILGELGAIAPDGTVVTIAVTHPDGSVARDELALTDGIATRRFAAAEPGTYLVTAITPFGTARTSAVRR